jgi:threonine dehydrogenase-like Zn-dependent dehydrogenase
VKAVQLVAPQQLKFVDLPAPVPTSGQVLVRMDYLAVCGSDLKFYDRTMPDVMYPMAAGRPCHECVGTVEASTVPQFQPGQRVIALIQTGGLVEHAVVPAELLVPLPDADIDPALWVLCQPMGTVMYSVHRIGSVLGKRVVVVGAGPIGLCFTDLMVRHGARQVIVTDVHDYRLDTARQIGATHTINAARDDVRERVSAITGGEMADVSIEACGLSETYQQVFDVLRSVYSKLPNIIVTNSAQAGERSSWVALSVDLVAHKRLDLSYLATHRFSWEEVPAAFDIFSARKDGALKCLIHVND